DISEAENTKACLQEKNVLIVAGELEILETLELLKHCSFLISNSTGTIHLAAAVNLPVVGLFGIRDVFGRWFPYGNQHKIQYHKFLDCDYRRENCVKKSVEMITVEEAIEACDSLISKIKI
ncbi:MAG: glycosyltransferase family 9 protein, partial [Patescibacteria group bacterium]